MLLTGPGLVPSSACFGNGFCNAAFFLRPGSQLVDMVGEKRETGVLWGEGEEQLGKRWVKDSKDK